MGDNGVGYSVNRQFLTKQQGCGHQHSVSVLADSNGANGEARGTEGLSDPPNPV
jgi:hypothetical protein